MARLWDTRHLDAEEAARAAAEGKCQGSGKGTRQLTFPASDPKLPGIQTKLFLKQSGEVSLGVHSESWARPGSRTRCLFGRRPLNSFAEGDGQVAVDWTEGALRGKEGDLFSAPLGALEIGSHWGLSGGTACTGMKLQ